MSKAARALPFALFGASVLAMGACVFAACATGSDSELTGKPRPSDAAIDSAISDVSLAPDGDNTPDGADTATPADGSGGCVGPVTLCGTVCVSLATDTANCGKCGNVCKAGEVCSAGVCALSCGGGTTKCGDVCVDLTKDSANCGTCGNACKGGEVCVSSMCSLACAGGTTKCGSGCVDTTKDPSNCGACGVVCKAGETCTAGKCEIVCAAPTTKCGTACVDTSSDLANCGTCGNACKAGEVCSAGKCDLTCAAPTTKCGTACVDTSKDLKNCGACGTACPSGPKSTAGCAAGKCSLACDPNFGDCDANPSTGCEVDLLTTAAHCGGCAKPCAAGAVCTAGTCMMVTSTTVVFPSTTSATSKGALGAGGTGRFYSLGDYVQESFARTTSATKLDVNFKMVDFTNYMWCTTGTLTWKLMVNGVQVGVVGWSAGFSYGSTKTIAQSFTFAAIAPMAGMFTLRYESTKAVCDSGGSWNWFAGGSAVLQ